MIFFSYFTLSNLNWFLRFHEAVYLRFSNCIFLFFFIYDSFISCSSIVLSRNNDYFLSDVFTFRALALLKTQRVDVKVHIICELSIIVIYLSKFLYILNACIFTHFDKMVLNSNYLSILSFPKWCSGINIFVIYGVFHLKKHCEWLYIVYNHINIIIVTNYFSYQLLFLST